MLRKNKGFASINIFGLALGMLMAMFITFWLKDEISFDQFHNNNDRIYQVNRHVHSGDQIRTSNSVTYNIASTFRDEYPEVEKVAVTTNPMSIVFLQENFSLRQNGSCAEPSIFDIFSWNILAGDPEALLDNPTSIVISSSLAAQNPPTVLPHVLRAILCFNNK